MTERDLRIEQLKQELKPMMKKVNQRLVRLEQGNKTHSHAYQAVQQTTGVQRPRFNHGGKTIEQLLQDKQRMQNFLDYKTSTITGTKNEEQRLAKLMRVSDPTLVNTMAPKFFSLSRIVQDYVRNSSRAQHISSDEVFMGISKAIEAGEVNLAGIDFGNFDLAVSQMETIVKHASGEQRSIDLEDQLREPRRHRGPRRVRPANRDDY